ncbi:MAG: hydrogenase [Campylobacterota bacterium]
MAIVQNIEYFSKNEYFSGFLAQLCKESGLKAHITQGEDTIVLKVAQNDSDALEKFGRLSQKYLPHSLFLANVQTYESEETIPPLDMHVKNYKIAPCPKCLEALSDPSSSDYLNDGLICTHYSNSGAFVEDETIFSPHYSKGDTLLLCDPSQVDTLFYLTDNEKKALFSIEKPTMKVTIKDRELIEQVGAHYIKIKSAPTVKSSLVALNAKESEIPYLFFRDRYGVQARVIKDEILLIQAGALENLEYYSDDAIMNRFVNIKSQSPYEEVIGASFGIDAEFVFLTHSKNYGQKRVIDFKPFEMQKCFEAMQKDAVRKVLLENFKEQFPQAYEKFANLQSSDIFEAIAVILELEGGYEAVSDKALEYRGNGGVKLDTKLIESGLDHMNFLATLISFKLAGTSCAHSAYSVFEAFADLGMSVLNQLKQKVEIDNFVLFGQMFENSVFYSRIKSKFAMNNPYFAKSIGLS